MPVRMSRTAGGGSSYTPGCKHGASGARGNGKKHNGGPLGVNRSDTLSWKNPPKKSGRSGQAGPMRRQPDNYYKLTRNPSGSSNMPVRSSPLMGILDLD